MTVIELRNKRAQKLAAARAFLESKSEVWIESERLYEVLYSFETEDSANGK